MANRTTYVVRVVVLRIMVMVLLDDWTVHHFLDSCCRRHIVVLCDAVRLTLLQHRYSNILFAHLRFMIIDTDPCGRDDDAARASQSEREAAVHDHLHGGQSGRDDRHTDHGDDAA